MFVLSIIVMQHAINVQVIPNPLHSRIGYSWNHNSLEGLANFNDLDGMRWCLASLYHATMSFPAENELLLMRIISIWLRQRGIWKLVVGSGYYWSVELGHQIFENARITGWSAEVDHAWWKRPNSYSIWAEQGTNLKLRRHRLFKPSHV